MYKLWNFVRIHKARCFSSVPSSCVVEHLKERSLIRVCGSEVSSFLQGLITNDINHLHNNAGSMYSMFLNTKGRVMYDTIIYRTTEKNSFLIECDKEALGALMKHLKIYRVRKKIDVVSLENEFNVYTLFCPGMAIGNDNTLDESSHALDSLISHSKLLAASNTCKIYQDLLIYRDPRIALLGSRILVPVNTNIQEKISQFSKNNLEHTYRWLRYNLGVGEGTKDLPPGECFPLEANCDYLHGVSYHKGCYVGQELTARTHHTGVVRKRLMPLYFSKRITRFPSENKIIYQNINLGKLRGVESDIGLGLLRIAKALEFNEIEIGDGIARTEKPKWWPLEAPKDKLSIEKSQ